MLCFQKVGIINYKAPILESGSPIVIPKSGFLQPVPIASSAATQTNHPFPV
jgi:hypothetical protein